MQLGDWERLCACVWNSVEPVEGEWEAGGGEQPSVIVYLFALLCIYPPPVLSVSLSQDLPLSFSLCVDGNMLATLMAVRLLWAQLEKILTEIYN